MSSKSKVAIVKKVRIAWEYMAGNISREEAARWAKVAPDVITGWARIYRQEGVLGLTPEKKKLLHVARSAYNKWASGNQSRSKQALIQMIGDYIRYYNTRRVQRNELHKKRAAAYDTVWKIL